MHGHATFRVGNGKREKKGKEGKRREKKGKEEKRRDDMAYADPWESICIERIIDASSWQSYKIS